MADNKKEKEINLYLELFDNYFTKLNSDRGKNKTPEFFLLTQCIEYLAKAVFCLEVSDNKIKTHSVHLFFYEKFMKNRPLLPELEAQFGDIKKKLDSLSKNERKLAEFAKKEAISNIYNDEQYLEIKNILFPTARDFLKIMIEQFKENKIIDVRLSIEELLEIKDLRDRVYKHYINYTLGVLSAIFSELHMEFRYFDKLDKNKFENSKLYQDLEFFISLLDELNRVIRIYLKDKNYF